MNRFDLSIAATLAAALLAGAWAAPPVPAEAAPATTILDCDFEAEPLDQVIGTGGPAAHQPVGLGGTGATVRALPLPTPSLELSDTWGSDARSVSFEFLDGVEITSGTLTVSMILHFAQHEDFTISLREHGGAATGWLDVSFQESGLVRNSDLDTPSARLIGTYSAAAAYVLEVVIDLTPRVYTYDLRLGANLLLDDESLGQPSGGVGIGRLLVTIQHDLDSIGTFYVDDVLVTATTVPTPVEPTTWGSVKALWR